MPEFTTNGFLRYGFGFYNPNHAAALICAIAPFCWGWRGRLRWVGYLAFAALCVALAMTYSRTGVVVMGLEMAAWGVICGRNELRPSRCGGRGRPPSRGRNELRPSRVAAGVAPVVALAAVAWWMRGRLSLDGAVMNRPKIWLAGLQLFAANPLGVGFGRSGEIASAFLLPDGVVVRTLVNSHLTLLVETGVFVGGAWLVFIAAALAWVAAGAKREGLRLKRGVRLKQTLDKSAAVLHDSSGGVSNLWGAFGTARRNLFHLRLHRLSKGL